jgi:hypothetical protein
MAKIPAARAAALFEEIIGWPYKLGGSGKTPGGVIDCSGAWVRVYRAFGLSLSHSANRQCRECCSQTGAINGVTSLQVGMAVFKCRPWTDADKGNSQYGKLPGNVYHVGCVTSVNPLRIVHATPDFAKVDTSLGSGAGRWQMWGAMKQVDLSGAITGESGNGTDQPSGGVSTPSGIAAPEFGPGMARVNTGSSNLNLRSSPSDAGSSNITNSMPRGTVVEVLSRGGTWAFVRYVDARGVTHRGYAAAKFLIFG